MKPINKIRNESGQILLILTVGIVALLGMVALAVDGGMIYADRRFDQNAADASAFAGAGAAALELQNRNINSSNFSCTGAFNADKSPKGSHMLYHPINSAIVAAQTRATSNNFTIPYPPVDQHGVEIICVSSGSNNYLDVRTLISSNVRTAFAHLFYKGEVRNSVEAVARVVTEFSIGGGGALTHLNTQCGTNDSLIISGNADMHIDGAWSNGCFRSQGNAGNVISDEFFYHLNGCSMPEVGSKDAYGCANDPVPDWPSFRKLDKPLPKIYLEDHHNKYIPTDLTKPEVDVFWNQICGTPSKAANFVGGRLPPGRYTQMHITGGVNILDGGLYCFDGNIDISGNGVLKSDDGVTIILINGAIHVRGGGGQNGGLELSAPKSKLIDANGEDFDYPNLLFYGAKYNTSKQQFNGNASSYLDGTLWFPDGYVVLNGTANEAMYESVQIIAHRIEVNGANRLRMVYDENEAVTFPSRVSLVK
jgi:Flp pilus assembly protein TadG